jgi:hypothetical protein
MDLQPVIDRLDGVHTRPVESVAALAALGTRPPGFLPAIYAVPDGEQPLAPRQLQGIHDQQLIATFVVVIMVGVEAANPRATARQLEALIKAVEDRLVGWAHPDAEGQATAHAGSALLSIADGRIEWALRFSTQRRIRKAVES